MCSIFGYYKFRDKNENPNFVANCLELMKHRGPDGQNFIKVDEKTGLGHQRLSIIDVSDEANQPMINKNHYIVFNGEVYNYIELKEDMQRLNIPFSTTSDTEVLLEGLKYYGIDFLHKSNGMFAFAFYDKNTKTLVLGRDRFGVKPLYYMIEDDILYFSSEIKPLISIKSNLEKNLNIYDNFIKQTATDYDENTFISGIYQLKNGHYLTCKENNHNIKQWYSWNDFTFDKNIFKNRKDTILFTEELLSDAISKRLRSDVPLCITLSGGLDSTTIYTLIKAKLKRDIKAYTFVHRGSPTNEYDKVKWLTDSFSDTLECVESDPNNGYEDLEEALHYLEFPIWNPSAIAYMDIYKKLQQRGYKVVIEGHGSDEQLGGYSPMLWAAFEEYLHKVDIPKFNTFYKAYKESLNPNLSKFANKNFNKYVFDFFKEYFKNIIKKYILGRKVEPRKLETFNEIVWNSFDYKILPIVLRTFDRLPMRSGLESRSPYMDYRVVEFFRNMPVEYKISNLGSKAILRDILKHYKKDFIYKDKRKMGFSSDLVAFLNNENVKKNLKKDIEDFNIKEYSELKNKALETINTKEKLGWEDGDLIGKISSLSYINKKYGI
ncbi:MAG: asparagine synthase (glutamine-hydrolyzing) [Spirochaetes bacterium GWD1_27_9]|nr:MAG: asparagine synthase (glutamine-hydrolyzing) [Spirochaetes bacterium GWB1_27_13]OHD21688.1 MAG: asparagine synthase (glutamine-hydrolyzing) [Spirochaetes bacterium GWC1_27_15]OHD44440.1 MAG: asparagine synthase (glutamine-hydrolyzing) [Spirochaetes bacterium GWD1_27_9]